MQLNAVVNAASNVAGAVSPGEIVTLYGAYIGPASAAGIQVKRGRHLREIARWYARAVWTAFPPASFTLPRPR